MKPKFSFRTLTVLTLLATVSADSYAGCCKLPRLSKPRVTISKPTVRIPIPPVRIPKPSIPKPVEVIVKPVQTAVNNTVNAVGDAIHDTGKVIGDGVKEIRGAVAAMKGVNIEKTLDKIRGQIATCRGDCQALNLATKDLELLTQELQSMVNNNPGISSEEIQMQAQRKLETLERLKSNTGTVGGLGFMLLGAGLNAGAATVSVGALSVQSSTLICGGGYTALAAAAMIAMMESASNEIEHEQKKLKECGKNYEAVFEGFKVAYQKYVDVLERDKTKADKMKAITEQYLNLTSMHVEAQVNPELGHRPEFEHARVALVQTVRDFQREFGQEKDGILNEMIASLEQMKEV